AHRALHRGVAARVAALSHFAPQPYRGEARKGGKPLAQIRQEWIGALLAARPRTIGRRLQTARDIFADRLTVDAELTGNGRNLQALPMKLQDHDEFSKFDHRAPPSRQGEKHRQESRRPGSRTLPARTGRRVKTGENSKPTNGEDSPAAQNL